MIGVSSPEAETIAVSSRRQRVQTKRTSCGDADQLERFTLAAIGQASQCEHDTRNRPGSSIPIPSDSASCPLFPMIVLCESFRCLGTVSATSAESLRAAHVPTRPRVSSALVLRKQPILSTSTTSPAFIEFEIGIAIPQQGAEIDDGVALDQPP